MVTSRLAGKICWCAQPARVKWKCCKSVAGLPPSVLSSSRAQRSGKQGKATLRLLQVASSPTRVLLSESLQRQCRDADTVPVGRLLQSGQSSMQHVRITLFPSRFAELTPSLD